MALGKGSPAHVLARKADRGALHQQRAEREGLREGPIKGTAIRQGVDPAREETLLQSGIESESFWRGCQHFAHVLQALPGDARAHRSVAVSRLHNRGGAAENGAVARLAEFHHALVAVF